MRRIPILLAIAVVLVGSPALSAERASLVRFGGAYVVPTGDATTDGFFVEDLGDGTRLEFQGDLTIEPTEAVGLFLSYEYRLSPLLGVEAALMSANHDVDGTLDGTLRLIDNSDNSVLEEVSFSETATVGDISVMPLTVGLNVHLLGDGAVDLYAGAMAGYVFFGDLELDLDGEDASASIDDDFTFGAVAGLDFSLGERWILGGAVRYLSVSAESEGDSLPVDPWVVQLHAGVRF